MDIISSLANANVFSAILESLDDAIMIHDLQGQILYANQHALDMFAIIDHATALHLNFAIDLSAEPDGKEKMERRLEQLGKEEDVKFEWLLKKTDGSLLNVELHLHLISLLSGEKVCLVQVHDTTSLKNVENALQDSEDKFRFMTEKSADIIWHMDDQYHFTYISPADEKLRGYKAEEVIGTTIFSLLKPEGIEHVKAVNAQRLEDENGGIKTGVVRYELELKCNDGSYVWTEINVNPYRSANGNFNGYYGVTRDISERKRAEAEIHQLNDDLDLRLKERTAQLEFANQDLVTTSYSIAHTLKTPLRAINGFSYFLLEEYDQQFDERGKDYLNRIRNASRQMGLLTDNLLTLLSITRGDLRITRINLSRLARQYMTTLKASQPEWRVEFTCPDTLIVEADPDLMNILIENLISNAWKFTGKCPIAHIELGTFKQENETIFFIRDNGVGFDMAYVENLFGNFQRLHSLEEFEGTGIGLAIVKRIIQRHGGRVWAEGQVDQGATFYFTLG